MRRGHARRQERPVRAVRRLLALPRLRLHQEGRPAAARPAAVRGHLPQEQGRPPRPASRAAHRQRLLGVLQVPQVRLHDEQRAARRPARRRRRPAGAQGRGGDLPDLRLDERHRPGRHRPGRALRGRPAESGGAGATGAWRRTRRRSAAPAAVRAGRRRRRRTRGTSARASAARQNRPRRRERGRGRPCDPPGARAVPPLAGGPRRLAAHDPRLHDGRRRVPRLARPSAASTGDAPRGPTCAPTSPAWGARRARTTVAQRLAAIRSFHRWAAREGLAAGDPWGAIATPRLPRRLPRVLEVDQVDRLLAAVDDELTEAESASPDRIAVAIALALRDRALVETAYAAGLRISELAAADLGSLDLRRGEIRVIGKGRKERIGLLGRPAHRGTGRVPGPRPADPAGRARPAEPAADEPPPNRARSSSTTSARRSASAACAIASTGCAAAPACRSACRRTRCATRSRRTCSTAGPTCASSRSCSATRTWPRPRSTPTSRRAGWRPRLSATPIHGRAAGTAA